MICARVHQLENHNYEINRCIIKKEKIYKHVLPKYRNYRSNHLTIVFKCPIK